MFEVGLLLETLPEGIETGQNVVVVDFVTKGMLVLNIQPSLVDLLASDSIRFFVLPYERICSGH